MQIMEEKLRFRLKAFCYTLLVLHFVSFVLQAILPDLKLFVPELLGLTAFSTLIVITLFYGSRRGWARWSPWTIIIMAAAMRLLFLFAPPQLSDDIHRYLFDGGRIIAGHNPYSKSPEQVAGENGSTSLKVQEINHSQLITIYPPGAQVIFGIGALWNNIIGMKLVMILLDLIFIALIMRLMSHMGQRPDQSILYAWHPLPVLEIASSGHIDGVALMFIFAAICLLRPTCAVSDGDVLAGCTSSGEEGKYLVNRFDTQRLEKTFPDRSQAKVSVFGSGIMFSFAILIKLLPIVFLPLCGMLVQRDRRIVFLSGLTLGSFLLILPFFPDICNMINTLRIYTSTWEFSGLAFGLLRDGLHSGIWARIILGLAFTAFWFYCYRTAARRKKDSPRSDECLFAAVLKALYSMAFVFLMVTPTLHPWYGLYMLGFLAFLPNPAGMILSWTILLGYRVLIPYSILNQWIEGGGVSVLIWVGPMAILLFSWVKGLSNMDATPKV